MHGSPPFAQGTRFSLKKKVFKRGKTEAYLLSQAKQQLGRHSKTLIPPWQKKPSQYSTQASEAFLFRMNDAILHLSNTIFLLQLN